MTELAVILGLMFSSFCGALAVAHSIKIGRMTLLDWSLLAIGGMYGLGWVVVLLLTHGGRNPYWEDWILPFSTVYPVHTIIAFFAVVSVLIGWYVLSGHIPIHGVNRAPRRVALKAISWSIACWVLLALSVLLQGIYTIEYGGYVQALEYSSLIRAGRFDSVPDNPWSFLKPFGGLAMIAAYGFFGLRLSGYRKINTLVGLFLSFGMSTYVLYHSMGRIGFLVFVLTFILGIVLSRRPRPLSIIGFGAVAFIGLLVSAYGLTVLLSPNTVAPLPDFLARQLAFPFVSFFAQWSVGGDLSRWFVDVVVAPVYLVPSSWWMAWIDSASQINTMMIRGAPKGEGGVTGTVPVDLLTLGLMQAYWFGVIPVGILFGVLLRGIQALIDRIVLHGVRAVLEAHVALAIAVLGVFYSDPHMLVMGNFPLMVGGLVIFIIARTMRVRRSHYWWVTQKGELRRPLQSSSPG